MAAATRDFLSVTSRLFDRSDDIFRDTTRFAKTMETQHAASANELVNLRSLATSAVDSRARDCLLEGDASVPAAILTDCRSAVDSLRTLAANSKEMTAARESALAAKATVLEQRRVETLARLTQQQREIDAEFEQRKAALAAEFAPTAPGAQT